MPKTVRIQRACNGCGEPLRDAKREEFEAAIDGTGLPDVRAECPTCSPDGGLFANAATTHQRPVATESVGEAL